MPENVIADTSCLIILSKIKQLGLLKNLYSEIIITKEIQEEFGQFLPEWIIIESVKDGKIKRILSLDVDLGEASAMALCLEKESPLLLIDEKKGRKRAKELDIPFTGTIGVLLRGKKEGYINSIKEEINKIRSTDFRISESLLNEILRRDKE